MHAASEAIAPAHRNRLWAGLAFASLLGCVHQQTPPAAPKAAVPPGPPAAAPSPPAASPAPPGPSATQPLPAPNPPARTAAGTAARAPAPKRPASAPPSSASAPGGAAGVAGAAGAAAASAAPSAAAPGPPALDLASLEQRLRDTHAIGVFTKLSLKNQVDDLLAQFRAFYAGRGGLTLAELRRSFELLLMKVVTLLQDDDPGLASAVSSSRETLWAILSDRNRLNNL
jgi:hypothetical protein